MCFGVEMPILFVALTAPAGNGDCHPASLDPCVRLLASNSVIRATLHHYHPDGEEVNSETETVCGEYGLLSKIAAGTGITALPGRQSKPSQDFGCGIGILDLE